MINKRIYFFSFLIFVICFFGSSVGAQATTELVSIIRENCAGYSDCYTSLASWEAVRNRDLVAADAIEVARIEGTWANADTTAFTIDGWTTDATRYIKIYTAPEARHSGKWNTGKYRLETINSDSIQIIENNTVIDGLQIKISGTFAKSGILYSSTSDNQISNSIIKIDGTVSGGITFSSAFGINKIWNNIVYVDNTASQRGINLHGSTATNYLYNNTIVGNFTVASIYTSWGTTIAKNNLIQGNPIDGFNNTFNSLSDYNISSLSADAPGTNSKNSITTSFADSANKDFHLSSSDTGAMDFGVNLSADANLAFTDDIDGTTRPQGSSWDIGADEVSAGAQPTYQCSDTIDNDSDGLTDYPNDPGCSSTTDNDEYSAPIITDTTPPTISNGLPTGSLSSGTTSATLSLTTNENSTCRYSASANTSYSSITNTFSTTGGTTHTQTLTGLTDGTSYNYYSKCQDTTGNANTADYSITFSVAQGQTQPGIPSNAIYITSLPFTANTAGGYYVLNSNLILNSGNAITITADNIILDGNNFEIKYADIGPGYGININTAFTSLEIKNLKLTQGNYDPQTNEYVHGIIRSGNFSGLKIHNNTININHGGAVPSSGGRGIYLSGFTANSSGNEIYSNIFNTVGSSGYNSTISISPSGVPVSGFKIYDNNITANVGYPVINAGGSDSEIYNNTITVNSSIAGNNINAIGVGTWSSSNGNTNAIIRNNTINLGGINSRAIILNGNSDNNKIHSNVINMTSQNTSSYNSSGIRLRYGADNNEIYSNTIDASGCAGNCFPIRYGGDELNQWNSNNNNIFHDNILTSATNVISVEGGAKDSHFYKNNITVLGTGTAIYMLGGGVSSETINNISFSHETINGNKKISLSKYPLDGTGSVGNITFCESGISQSDITQNSGVGAVSITSAPCAYGETQPPADTTPPTISNISSSPATNSTTITFITSELSDTQIQYGPTTSYGQTTTLDANLVISHSQTISSLTQNTSYNYRIITKDSSGNTAMSSNYIFTTQSVPDSTPPSTISNLSLSSITQSSMILSWTIPTDASGISGYDIRYDTSSITNSNFNVAAQVSNPPTPSSQGTTQQYTLVGLASDTVYYLAIKSKDPLNNTSGISNIPQAVTLSAPSTQSQTPSTQSGTVSVSSSGGGFTIYQVSDSTPPSTPSSAKANPSSSQVSLSWSNPTDSDFVRVKILRKTNSQPTSHTDGVLIYEGNQNTFTDINLQNDQIYYYAIYAYDNVPNYSNPQILSVTPKSNITQISAIVPTLQTTSGSIIEGSLIRGPDGIKVYIVNAHNYKRHIFNPEVFNMYGHFKWNEIKDVDQQTLDSYQASDLYRADTDTKVFSLKELDEKKGLAQKRWFNLSGDAFIQKGYNFNQVFIINSKERDFYQEGTPISETESVQYPSGSLVKSSSSPDIYLIVSNKKIKIKDQETLFDWNHSFSQVKEIPAENLSQFQDLNITFYLVRAKGGTKIYRIISDQKLWIKTTRMFLDSGYQSHSEIEISQEDLNLFSDVRYIKLKNSPQVYELKNNKKYLLKDTSKIPDQDIKIVTEAEMRGW